MKKTITIIFSFVTVLMLAAAIVFYNSEYYIEIKGSTNIVGLIGHPVEHSFSPPMHNAAFDKLNMDYAYVAFDVDSNNLKSAIDGAKSLNIKGYETKEWYNE